MNFWQKIDWLLLLPSLVIIIISSVILASIDSLPLEYLFYIFSGLFCFFLFALDRQLSYIRRFTSRCTNRMVGLTAIARKGCERVRFVFMRGPSLRWQVCAGFPAAVVGRGMVTLL